VLFPPAADELALPFYLQSEGYGAYHVVATASEIIGHAGCWAHVRRTFVDAASGRHAGAAPQMVALIGERYAVERRIRDADPETRARRVQPLHPHAHPPVAG
jgi:transposase